MIGFTSTSKIDTGVELFSPTATMNKDERAARFNAQREGDRRTVSFGFTGQATPLTQVVSRTTDPAAE